MADLDADLDVAGADEEPRCCGAIKSLVKEAVPFYSAIQVLTRLNRVS